MKLTDVPTAPASAEELRAEIVSRYETLSKRLKQIARYILDELNDIALETLAVIADRCGVQPSAIVRFAKGFGFEGASQMQRLFRDGLLSNNAALGYSERVRQLDQTTSAQDAEPACAEADLFLQFAVCALEHVFAALQPPFRQAEFIGMQAADVFADQQHGFGIAHRHDDDGAATGAGHALVGAFFAVAEFEIDLLDRKTRAFAEQAAGVDDRKFFHPPSLEAKPVRPEPVEGRIAASGQPRPQFVMQGRRGGQHGAGVERRRSAI